MGRGGEGGFVCCCMTTASLNHHPGRRDRRLGYIWGRGRYILLGGGGGWTGGLCSIRSPVYS